MGQSQQRENLPLIIALFVYDGAKKNILTLEYDVLRTYCLYNEYQLLLTDTDSLWVALAAEDGRIESIVRPELRKHFFTRYNDFFPLQACARHHSKWFEAMMNKEKFIQKKCCLTVEKLDSVTPLLFKREFFARRCIALCAKTYICDGGDASPSQKSGTKGLNRQSNLRYNHFMHVLKCQRAGVGLNQGIVSKKNSKGEKKTYSYYQRRDALAYFYMKKRVDTDGVTCHPTMA